jgi:polysaccharide biosynthesis protein PslG
VRDPGGRRSARFVVAIVTTLVASLAVSALPASASTSTARVPRPLDGRNVGVSLYGSVFEWSSADLARDLDRIEHMGATWVRVPFNWVTLEMHGRGQYNWAPADALMRATNARHLRVLAVVSYTPAWARPAGRPATDPPTNLDDYARFVGALASRYGPRGLHHFEIWNEPNLTNMWTPKPDPARYTALLREADRAIKRADRRAVVLTAGLSPASDAPDGTQIAPVTFVTRMYASGARGAFDAIGHHPSTYPYRSTYVAPWSAFQQARQMYDVMRAHGDATKRIWASEIAFPTGRDPLAVTEQQQAKYLVEALQAWSAYRFSAPVFVYSMRDEGSDLRDRYQNFGLVHRNGAAKPAYLALRRALRARRG